MQRNGNHRREDGNSERRRREEERETGGDQNSRNEIVQAIKMIGDAIVDAIRQRPHVPDTPPIGTPMLSVVKAMKNLKTPYFEGSPDPIGADQWFKKLEKNLETAMCPEDLKKRIGAYYLDKDAADWWESHEKQLEQPVMWSAFKSEFERKYFTPESRLRLQREFLNLRQGNKTVREYESEFMRLRRHALPGQDDEKAMITNFMFGVRPELESILAVGTYTSLTELIEKAVNVESSLNAEKAARRNIGGKNTSRSQKSKQMDEDGEDNEWSKETRFSGICYNCGERKHRSKECTGKKKGKRQQGSRDDVCFKCGRQGHYSFQCSAMRPIPTTPLATRPPQALPAIESAPKRRTVGGKVYAVKLDDSEPLG